MRGRWPIVQFVLCVAFVFSQHWWCQFISFSGVEMCWVVSATPLELHRGFPNYHRVAHLANWLLDYGLLILSVGILLWKYGKALRANLLLACFSAFFTLALGEVGLRVLGWRPGQFNYSQWAHPVDSLVVVPGMYTGADGITKVDTSIFNGVLAEPEVTELEFVVYYDSLHLWNEPLDAIRRAWYPFTSDSGVAYSEFNEHRLDLLYSGKDPLSAIDSNFLAYVQHPINRDGFYSPPFDTVGIGSNRILLLGDSFTWGHSAKNVKCSFANTLLARGYAVYNTGISGADVPQYQRILREYGPKLRPKVVVLNFFMGNDVGYFERIPKPGIPVHFYTNAGAILSSQLGDEFSNANDAYANLMRNMEIPKTTLANRICSKTVVTTLLWELLAHQGIIDHEFASGKQFPPFPLTPDEMKEVVEMCDSLGAELILSVIPKLEDGQVIGAESIPGLFGDVPYHQPRVTASMYMARDGHFNKEGHLFYANYLEKLIRASLDSIHAEQ